MRFWSPLLLGISLFSPAAFAQDLEADLPAGKSTHSYQSDVARLRGIVINRFLSARLDVFLRELISNANDALEKLRLTALTDKGLWDGTGELNITIKAVPGEDGERGRIIIADNGIGMTKEELTANLGTLAKSGTTEFLQRAEGSDDATGTGNLIGAFGVGFYSSFLVADKVYVASVPARSSYDSDATQYVFSSTAEDNEFDVYPDPRGRTLERGTEITLVLKPDAEEYLDTIAIAKLVHKHSVFSTQFPIYMHEMKDKEVPDEDAEAEAEAERSEKDETDTLLDEDEAIIEDIEEEGEKPEPKTKTIKVEDWVMLNAQPPLWTQDPKNISSFEYELFYQATFKDFAAKPLAWHHFSGDLGSGISFRTLLYLPGKLPEVYWQNPLQTVARDIRLMVKRVFITDDMGEDYLPKWASWLKAIVDGKNFALAPDDLPLNVSRETLQNTSFLRQIRSALLKRILQTFTKIAEEDTEKFEKVHAVYGNVFKLGAVEDTKNKEKLASLARFATNIRNFTSFDQYLEEKKENQKQIFYVADAGKTANQLMKSVFVEKLIARGYEVLLLVDPLDEVLVNNLKKWKGIPFQDAAKAGLKFGDEKLDSDEDKALRKEEQDRFEPLTKWLKKQVDEVVRDVIVSDRLVSSPCAIVADERGYTANIQRMMNAAKAKLGKDDPQALFHDYAKRQKVLEINPRSPLIQGLLKRVERLPEDEDERDAEAEDELREVAAILIDGALVRSGFEVTDSDEFMVRVDRVLRRSLGVDEHAPTDTAVKPAPPVDPELQDESFYEPEPEEDDGKAKVVVPDHLKDDVAFEMEEISDEEYEKLTAGSMRHEEL
ncbi:heat shock protein Hsp90 [Vararia minispora EC-137]|uniref:Heat shock protein Hsp90 n=1 Tax=Vararia minispora EC-137 TaxID=1314806 RepID=A0ACB8QYQ8_9AGAM|nr:heat shock protein Hsp90 [Vararia minispora EC-137]